MDEWMEGCIPRHDQQKRHTITQTHYNYEICTDNKKTGWKKPKGCVGGRKDGEDMNTSGKRS